MNIKTLGLIALLALLLFVAATVLADVKAERIKINVSKACIEKVQEAAGTVEGVIETNWDEEKGELEIIFEQSRTSLQEIEQAISEAGFNTPSYKADKEAATRITEECRMKNTASFAP